MKMRQGIQIITLALFLSLTAGCRWFNGSDQGDEVAQQETQDEANPRTQLTDEKNENENPTNGKNNDNQNALLKSKNPQWNSKPSLVQQLDDTGIALEALFRNSLLIAPQGDQNLIVSLLQFAEGMNAQVILDLDAGSVGLISFTELKFL